MTDPDASPEGEKLDPPPPPGDDRQSAPPPGDKASPPGDKAPPPGDKAPPPGDEGPPPGDKGPPQGRRFKPVWVVPVVIAVLLAALGGTETWYVQENGAFCAKSCHHPSEPGGKTHEDHAGTTCQTCHTTRASTGWKLLLESWITKPDKPHKHGKVEPSTCKTCHEAQPAKWPLIAQTQGHRDHATSKTVNCLSCHSLAAHGGKAIEEACRNCHEDQRLHKPTTENAETCLSCHSFAVSPDAAKEPTTLACEKCHADEGSISRTAADGSVTPMKTVDEHVLHGGVACQLCHNAHGKKLRPPEGKPVCVRCHQIEIFTAGKEVRTAPEGHSNCEQCHKPHEPLQTALDSCRNCHAKNAGALAIGAPLPPGGAAAPSTALKHTNCASCHLPHSWRAEPAGCKTCHAEKAQMILTRSPAQHGSCTSCHEVHGPPPTGSVCLTCHAKTRSKHVALAPSRHKDCTSCHNPHSPSPADTRGACAKCHVSELAQAMREGPTGHVRGKGCLTCHKPHESPLPSATVCDQCHANKRVLVALAGPSAHKDCASCHRQHTFAIRDMASACSRCHGSSGATKGVGGAVVLEFAAGSHQGPCKNCHQPHGTLPLAKSECFKCHAPIEAKFKAPTEKHAVCRSCHEPHQPAKAAPAKCGTCHQQKVLVAAQWPEGSAHNKACNDCHQSHAAREKKACADCHAKESTSAAGGKHQCVQCHPPHKAPPGKGAAWWSRCNECHAAKVESVKELGAKHSDCKNCHLPHKFSPPKCDTCHTDPLVGLHIVKGHYADCTECHDAHVKGNAPRKKCLSCHSDRQDHQKDAETCFGCHVFKVYK